MRVTCIADMTQALVQPPPHRLPALQTFSVAMAADSVVLQGKQLVVRMQYDDTISVTQCYLEQVLSSIDQVRHLTEPSNHKLL